MPLPPGWLVGLTADDGAHNADGLCWVGADGPVPMSRVEQVRKEIMAVVREMATEGGLAIQLFREPTVE